MPRRDQNMSSTKPRFRRYFIFVAAFMLSGNLATLRSQQRSQESKPVLYVIATSHLDSQWNWTVQDTIREFVPNTFLRTSNASKNTPITPSTTKAPSTICGFKEYHPEAWPMVQKYVADGRWKPAGSWINAVDVNVPSLESLMRQALYGKRFFRQEFGQVSRDVYLPDCFGFGFALAVGRHAFGSLSILCRN